jgi:tRNA nucleotidyltransferase/poly(A) polymerase
MSSILSISQYRVLSEIERVFGVTETSKAIEELYNLGLFATLFPEIAAAISAKPSILSIISKAVEMTQ